LPQPRFNPYYRQPWAPRFRRRGGLGALGQGALSADEISQYAQNAGFSGYDLQLAVAIAFAESSGIPTKYNPEKQAGTPPGRGSYGLWQIYLKEHPEFAGQNLLDPQTNANAAYSVYSRAGGFWPWSTYNSRAFEAYMPAESTPAPIPPALAPTFDASTGQPIPDATATPTVTVQEAAFFGGASNATVGTIAAGIGLLALYDLVFG
jgi:lysozyme-like protein